MRYCRTKIVCTLGPASSTRDALRGLVGAGLNVARINFSHSTHEQHAATIALIRDVATETKRPIAILGDLQGPRIRIGELKQARELAEARYKLGLSSIVELSQAQLNWTQAEIDQTSAKYDYQTQLSVLNFQLGSAH